VTQARTRRRWRDGSATEREQASQAGPARRAAREAAGKANLMRRRLLWESGGKAVGEAGAGRGCATPRLRQACDGTGAAGERGCGGAGRKGGVSDKKSCHFGRMGGKSAPGCSRVLGQTAGQRNRVRQGRDQVAVMPISDRTFQTVEPATLASRKRTEEERDRFLPESGGIWSENRARRSSQGGHKRATLW
jgi:hypothetical protein